VIDPVDPQVLYTNAGYNRVNAARSGLFKTTNGGVDWTEIWPPKDKAHANLLGHNLVTQVNINPGNNLHLLLGFHEVCAPPHSQACFAETRDGGNTWTIHNGDPRWQFSHSQTPYIIDDQTWLFANHDDTGGLWVTTDAGKNWKIIAAGVAGHWPAQLYRAASGWYIGSNVGIFFSPDGRNWSTAPIYKGSLTLGLVGDGKTMWASNFAGYAPWSAPGTNPFIHARETDGKNWSPTPWPTPGFTNGGLLSYDPIRHVLYVARGMNGFWRVAVK
jgi:photosystem II stability/assembly factor-like uncharacterized protein